jgi:ribonuclease HI
LTARDPSGTNSSARPPLVAIYADESCLGNGREGSNPGGAAGVIEYMGRDGGGGLTRWDYWVSEPGTTNNRMALRSVIEAVRAISRKGMRFRVVFTSDSQYLVKGMSEWVFGWMSRGWKRKEGPILNLELWQEAVDVVRDGGHQMDWRWVRGHEGHPQNEYANYLAVRAAREQTQSGGIVASKFDEWLSVEREKERVTVEPQAFPTDDAFRASRQYPVVARPNSVT